MSESEAKLKRQAATILRRLWGQEPPRDTDPILELISFLVTDNAGQVLPGSPIPEVEWLTWNRLRVVKEAELSKTVTRFLLSEEMEFPEETEAMREFAEEMLLSTLDFLQT